MGWSLHLATFNCPWDSVGPWELVVIVVIVLIIFGAGKLPEVGRSLGRGIREFKEVMNEPLSKDDDSSTKKPTPTEKPD
jgi:sec-independent protein translocase protein TatA